MIQNINLHACAFAAMVSGALTSFQHLHVVTYNYRSSPSLAYWIGDKMECTKDLHFISSEIRDKHIEELRKHQTSFMLFRVARRIQSSLRAAVTTFT